jgi:hypothetical protein
VKKEVRRRYHVGITGIEVDPNILTFTLPEPKRAELIAGVEEFCRIPIGELEESIVTSFENFSNYLVG